MKIKEKLIHWLGGITLEEVPYIKKKIKIVEEVKPIIPLAVDGIYYNFEPEEAIQDYLVKLLADEIKKLNLYTFEKEGFDENRFKMRAKIKIVEP